MLRRKSKRIREAKRRAAIASASLIREYREMAMRLSGSTVNDNLRPELDVPAEDDSQAAEPTHSAPHINSTRLLLYVSELAGEMVRDWHLDNWTSESEMRMCTEERVQKAKDAFAAAYLAEHVNAVHSLEGIAARDVPVPKNYQAAATSMFADFWLEAVAYELKKLKEHKVFRWVDRSTMPPGKRCIDTKCCLLYTSPSPRDGLLSRMPSSA